MVEESETDTEEKGSLTGGEADGNTDTSIIFLQFHK